MIRVETAARSLMAGVMLTSRQCAEVLRALGDETRLNILESLLVREKCVTDLVKEMNRVQPHISHHLGILRSAGLVEGVRAGKRICYRVAPDIQKFLKGSRYSTLDFGCCRLSFPRTVLMAGSGEPIRAAFDTQRDGGA